MIHEIATDTGAFEDITAGRKSYIMQKDTDAMYQVGDFLALNDVVDEPTTDGDAVTWTGRCSLVEVVHISRPSERYTQPGTIVLSIRPCCIGSYLEHYRHDMGRDVYEVPVYSTAKEREK